MTFLNKEKLLSAVASKRPGQLPFLPFSVIGFFADPSAKIGLWEINVEFDENKKFVSGGILRRNPLGMNIFSLIS